MSNPYSGNLIYYSKHFEGTCEENEADRLYHEQAKKKVLLSLNYRDLRSQTRYLYENVRPYFRDFHYGNRNLFNTSFYTFLNFKPEFILEIRNLLENYGAVKSKDDNEIAKFLKFYMDAVFISQFYWFISLGEEYKIEILNKYYDDFDLCISYSNLNLFGKSSLLHYLTFDEARKLFEAGDRDYARNILNTVLENTDDEFLKFKCVFWIAYTHRGKNDFKSSLKYFEEAYEISRQFTNDTSIARPLEKFQRCRGKIYEDYWIGKLHFTQYLVLLNMAEMYCYLQNKEKANDCYEKINSEIEKYSIPKKIDILRFLALYCNYYQQFMLESRYYQMVLSLAETYEDNVVDSIEKDMDEEIFSLLEFGNKTKEEYVQQWIDWRIEEASKKLTALKDVSSETENWADLVKVYDDYNKSFEYNPERVGKVEMILKSSKLDDGVHDVYSVVPNTLEPRRRIVQIKNTMNELREFEGKKNERYFDIKTRDLIQRLKLECSRCYYVLEDFNEAERILREILVDSKEESMLFNAHCILGMVLIKSWDVRSGINNWKKRLILLLKMIFIDMQELFLSISERN